mgnify:FL=1
MARRRVLIAQAHMAAKQLGLDDDTRRAVQAAVTGTASCADMTEAELARLIQHYHGLGAEVVASAPRSARDDGPTPWQLITLERLAFDMGWRDGLNDARLVAFIKRTARVDRPEWLTREQASATISGLLRWKRQRERRRA